MPAAQAVESHCYITTVAGSNRWSRSSGSTAQASSRPPFPDSQYGDGERHRSPPGGYVTRKREEIPPENQRTPVTLPNEVHMAFCEGYRHETDGFKLRKG